MLTRRTAPQHELTRLALGPDDAVHPDVLGRAGGRGAWIGVRRDELERALAKGKLRGVLARAFRTNDLAVPVELPARIADALERATLDRLGMEARASTLLTGSSRIEEAARSGAVELLLHAADARPDGRRSLDQAWRVGRDREGSGEQGVVLPVDRDLPICGIGARQCGARGRHRTGRGRPGRSAGRPLAALPRQHERHGRRARRAFGR